MKPLFAILILLAFPAFIHATPAAEMKEMNKAQLDCSAPVVGKCTNEIKQSYNLLRDGGAIGNLQRTRTQNDDICNADPVPEASRCYFDVLLPCSEDKSIPIHTDTLAMGKVFMTERFGIVELCGSPTFREKYEEMSKCYQQNKKQISSDCSNKVAVKEGIIKEGGHIKNPEDITSLANELERKTPEEKFQYKCCMINKIQSCNAEGLGEKCGETMKEFFLTIPNSIILEQKEECGIHFKDECSAGINLTVGFSLIFTAIIVALFLPNK